MYETAGDRIGRGPSAPGSSNPISAARLPTTSMPFQITSLIRRTSSCMPPPHREWGTKRRSMADSLFVRNSIIQSGRTIKAA